MRSGTGGTDEHHHGGKVNVLRAARASLVGIYSDLEVDKLAVCIARAFLAAGASSLGVSLWPVDDRATRELMVQFYRRYHEGAGAAAAMRGAMRAMP